MNRPFHDVPPIVQAAPQPQERRVALVVGNGKYVAEKDVLINPPNDARALAEKLSKIGFHGVTPQGDDYGVDFGQPGVVPLIDLDLVSLGRAFRALEKASRGARQAVIYFAGHGIEVEGQNYLIPTTARLGDIADVKYETHSLARALEAVQGASGLRLVILDACRSNPFHTRLFGTRGGEGGLGFVDPGSTLVFYAAKHGKPALDGVGQTNSPFATALLKHIDTQGIEVMRLFRLVRDEVLRATKSQEPYWYGTHGAEDQFFVAPTPIETPSPVEVLANSPVDDRTIEHTFWQSVKDTSDPAELIAFLEKFPTGTFAALAFERAKTLIDAVKTTNVLRRLLGRYPSSKLAPRLRRRLAALEWEQLNKSRDSEKLTAFAKEFDGLPEAAEATQRVAALTRKPGGSRRWPIVIGGAGAVAIGIAFVLWQGGHWPFPRQSLPVAAPSKVVRPEIIERQFADIAKTGSAEALRAFAIDNPTYAPQVGLVLAERDRTARAKADADRKAAEQAAADAKVAADARRRADLAARIARENNREALLKIAADETSQRAAVEQRLGTLGYIQVVTTGGAVWRQPGKGEAFEDCFTTSKGARVCVPMAVLPKGRFLMGSPKDEIDRLIKDYPQADAKWFRAEAPEREVEMPRAFAVATSHVTRGQFAAFVAAKDHKMEGGCLVYDGKEWKRQSHRDWRAPGFDQNDDQPVVCVNWNDAAAFAAWMKELTGLDYRLLTEAEAEYAARGVTIAERQPRYFFGNDTKLLCTYGNGGDLTGAAKFSWDSKQQAQCKDDHSTMAPVRSFKPNPFGLFDVHGNAWTWAQDCYKDTYEQAPEDGTKAVTSSDCIFRVLRGGSWNIQPQYLRSANRNRDRPDNRLSDVGFRLARTLNP